MAKKKYPSELSTRTIRINISTYLLLNELCRRTGDTMAETLDRALTIEQARQDELIFVPRSPQLRMMPVVTPIIAVNGSHGAALGTKVKGVKYG